MSSFFTRHKFSPRVGLWNEITTDQLEAISDFDTYIEGRTRLYGREDRRAELFDDAGLPALGLPIARGPTQANAKSLGSVRMKRCGDRWSVEGARATLTCRAVALIKGRWDIIWPKFADSSLAEVIPLRRNVPPELPRRRELETARSICDRAADWGRRTRGWM